MREPYSLFPWYASPPPLWESSDLETDAKPVSRELVCSVVHVSLQQISSV